MLTNNFMSMLLNSNGLNIETNNKGVKMDGNTGGGSLNFGSNYNAVFGNELFPYALITVGSGTTPPKITDYDMENEIVEGVDCSALTKRKLVINNKTCIEIAGMITNIGETPITVNEVGLTLRDYSSRAKDYNKAYRYLLAREVFDTPITISPGGGTVFQLKNLLTSLFQRGGAAYAY